MLKWHAKVHKGSIVSRGAVNDCTRKSDMKKPLREPQSMLRRIIKKNPLAFHTITQFWSVRRHGEMLLICLHFQNAEMIRISGP